MYLKYESVNSFNENGKHLSIAAWENSRDLTEEPKLEEVLAIDVPVNEFASAVVHIKSTILEREVLVTLRDHIMWARSSRVDDITKWTVPEPYYSAHQIYYDTLRDKMFRQKGSGVPQDEYRLLTPILAETEYTTRITLRTAVKLYLYFIDLAGTTHLPALFESAASEMYNLIVDLSCGHADAIVNNTRYFDINPVLKSKFFLPENSGKMGDMFSITMIVPFSMRTHLVRHRSLIIRDTFKKMITSPDVYKFSLDDKIEVQATGDIQFWKAITSSRSCWIAQHTLWKPVLDKLIEVYDLGEDLLPCVVNGGSCPYAGDVEQRFKGADPGVPCPKFAQLNKRALTTSQQIQIMDQIVVEDRPDFWAEITDGFMNGGLA